MGTGRGRDNVDAYPISNDGPVAPRARPGDGGCTGRERRCSPWPRAARADNDIVYVSSTKNASIKVAKGKPKTIVTSAAFYQIVIGDPEIANVNPLTDKSFYVLGNNLGTTGIALFDEKKQLVGTVDIEVTLDTDQLASTIRASVPDAKIKVGSANGRVVLSGEADDAVAAEKANKIATRFSGNEEVINSVNISSSQQVQLNVRFVEINRQAGQDLGAKYSANFAYGIGGRNVTLDPARCRRRVLAKSSAACCRTAFRSTSPSRRWRSVAWPGGWPSRT